MTDDSLIARNLASIRARIAAAAHAAGRPPNAITLMAVSKTHDAAAITAALAAGQTLFGENRVQEAMEKFPPLLAAHPQLRLHLIGPLQTNKVKDAMQLCHSIDSLDRPRLADAIARHAEATGHCPQLLVQINIGDEPQKAGIPTTEAPAFIRQMQTRFGTHLQGLMCIPPAGANPAPYFQHLTNLADEASLPTRSMGMSGDFEAAIEAGTTHVRVGGGIFGSRR